MKADSGISKEGLKQNLMSTLALPLQTNNQLKMYFYLKKKSINKSITWLNESTIESEVGEVQSQKEEELEDERQVLNELMNMRILEACFRQQAVRVGLISLFSCSSARISSFFFITSRRAKIREYRISKIKSSELRTSTRTLSVSAPRLVALHSHNKSHDSTTGYASIETDAQGWGLETRRKWSKNCCRNKAIWQKVTGKGSKVETLTTFSHVYSKKISKNCACKVALAKKIDVGCCRKNKRQITSHGLLVK